MPTRRTALLTTAAAALALAAPAHAAVNDRATRALKTHREPGSRRIRLALPAPTGNHPVGTVSLHLVDRARRDPWLPDRPHRELMVDVRYPARTVHGHPRAPQMRRGAADGFAALNNLADVPADRVDWAATLTHAYERAPLDSGVRSLPVVLYSPGVLDPRTYGTTTADDLASRGFLVVMVDHTYDATAVEFPGGRVEHSRLPDELEGTGGAEEQVRALLRKTLAVRVADLRFVLDALPSALPPLVRRAGDLARVGAYGQSAGGFAAMQLMHDDQRVRCAANLDGVLAHVQDDKQPGHFSSVAVDGVDRPYLLLGKEGNSPDTVPSWGALVRNSSGPGRVKEVRGAAHGSFTDSQVLIPQVARELGLSADVVEALVGRIAPERSVAVQQAALAGLFGRLRTNGTS
ncbi:hydrolase [Streptomyces triticagri]|uniref:Hydrolase n=1 Tax=Streptomyces triticagri TaxID=2293568 RepID=A0A372LWR7_9ACTN|nr:hydrolase [Streptomyces triticagri]RFU83118.1 hydrolase [Streptomyces triticagri]